MLPVERCGRCQVNLDTLEAEDFVRWCDGCERWFCSIQCVEKYHLKQKHQFIEQIETDL